MQTVERADVDREGFERACKTIVVEFQKVDAAEQQPRKVASRGYFVNYPSFSNGLSEKCNCVYSFARST